MLNLILAVVIVAIVLLRLSKPTQAEKKTAYKWWYLPWFGALYGLLILSLYALLPPVATLLPPVAALFQAPQLEAALALLAIVVWMIVSPLLLKKDSLHTTLTNLFRKVFAHDDPDASRVLPFPYAFDPDGTLHSRVGTPFYRSTVRIATLILAIVHALGFLVAYIFSINYPLFSALGLLAIIPASDYYRYLCCEAAPRQQTTDSRHKQRMHSDFNQLWQWYLGCFGNHTIAWHRPCTDPTHAKQEADNNDALVADLLGKMRDKHMDGILENCDLAEAFIRIEPLLNWVEKNGKYNLVALDLPPHFRPASQSYTASIAQKLTQILRRPFVAYDSNTTRQQLSTGILVASIPLLSRSELDDEWLSRIGLVTVVGLQDKGISNLIEYRKFCFRLQATGSDYQLLFLTSHRRGIEPSLGNTWVSSNQCVEVCLSHATGTQSRYYIGYNFEDYRERIPSLLSQTPQEPLYSGYELALLAGSSTYCDNTKPVTPVHFLDLAYTSIVEGREEFHKALYLVKKDYFTISADNLGSQVVLHTLPIVSLKDDGVLSVVFDQQNNAPSTCAKWAHLGRTDNFTIVVSRPYLFRDYFNANFDYFFTSPLIPLQPQLTKSRITLAIILLDLLRRAPIPEKRLRDIIRYYFEEAEVGSIYSTIRTLFNTYFAGSLADNLQTFQTIQFVDGRYSRITNYSLDVRHVGPLSYLEFVSIQDESGNTLFRILRDLLFQNYDFGQIHSFSGKPYCIKEYDEQGRTLKVSAGNNSDVDIVFYRPVLEIELSGERTPIKEIVKIQDTWRHPTTQAELSILFEGFETNLAVQTKQWYTFHHYSVLDSSCTDSHSPCRTYPRGRVLKVTLHFLHKQEYIDRIDDIRLSLQLLIHEALRSVFPQHAQYLLVATQGQPDPKLPWIFNTFSTTDPPPQPGTLSFYFIEDAHVDLGLIGALANKDTFGSNYLFRYIYDYLLWLLEGEPAQPSGYQSYQTTITDKFSFLKYGLDQLPSYLDIDLLINFLRDFFCKDQQGLQGIGIDRTAHHDIEGVCDFCRTSMPNSAMQRLSDGRMRCPDCSVDAVDTPQQFATLQRTVHDLFRRHLHIDFNTIPHQAKLVSAVSLHRQHGYILPITNGYDARKIVGLASSDQTYFVEDGRKPLDTLGIIAHELTHIWQFSYPPFQHLVSQNPDWTEGLAVWTDLFLTEQYQLEHGLPSDRQQRTEAWLRNNDEYGRGLKLILDNYPDNPYHLLFGL